MTTINAQNLFQSKLAFGQVAEGQIEAWLRRDRKYAILPAYEGGRDNKGPRLFGPNGGSLVTPDILAIRKDATRWIEVKHKTHFSWYRKGGCWVTGIDLKYYDQYKLVAKYTPFPVWLLFLHSQSETNEGSGKCPTGLYGGDIQYLATVESHRFSGYGKSGMVYWAEQKLKRLASLQEVQKAAKHMGYSDGGLKAA